MGIGPIIATETGRVHALCSRFQPLIVPQKHIKMKDGKEMSIMIPSLYGVVSSLDDPRFLVELDRRGIALAED
jgi:serine protease Do